MEKVNIMAPYSNDDDIKDFLSQFEGKMQLGNVPEDEWVKYLVEVITGKAREACQGIHYTEATYDQMKEQLLSYFNIVPSSQLDRLKQYRWNDKLTPEEYVMKTEILLDRWLTPHEGIGQMREKLTIDRSLEGISEPMRKWVREKEPKTKTEVITSMRVYLECHRRSERDVRSKNSFTHFKIIGEAPKTFKQESCLFPRIESNQKKISLVSNVIRRGTMLENVELKPLWFRIYLSLNELMNVLDKLRMENQ